ncbi:MAG: hypothetical protein AB2L11_09540 [Syntrophobacteraceae bacterium]
MAKTISRIHFDKQDYELLRIVNDVLSRAPSRKSLKSLLVPYMHPNGIKEMAAPKELRIAYAVINLLDMLEVGGPGERLTALRCVRDEVLHCARSELRNNTGRVLLQIMKELVRETSFSRQLELAHDFRTAATGKPRVIREQLKRFHLLEMPEAWNQRTFDGHVHDAFTKGRKSPTHLIMDAWIKGIRSLTVIYYNHITEAAASELLDAAEIMGVQARIGIEFSAEFRGDHVQLIWSPRGFFGTQEFLQFLSLPEMVKLMDEGSEVSEYQKRHGLEILDDFNLRRLPAINTRFGLDLQPLDRHEFLAFVGSGQASMLHLAQFIHDKLQTAMHAKVDELREHYKVADTEHRTSLMALVDEMNALDLDRIQQEYLSTSANIERPSPDLPTDDSGIPTFLSYSPGALVERLARLHATYRIILNLTGMRTEDLVEILYECRGYITHLELFNLKDYVQHKTGGIAEINELQRAINAGNIIRLKQIVKQLIRRVEDSGQPDAAERTKKLTEVLHKIGNLLDAYRDEPLRSRLGSDSTGRSTIVPGMGLAIRDTLPRRAQKELSKDRLNKWIRIPVRRDVVLRVAYAPAWSASRHINTVYKLARRLPGLRFIGMKRYEDWVADSYSTRLDPQGNIISLGGVHLQQPNPLRLEEHEDNGKDYLFNWEYLNSGLKNSAKIMLGFIPAFLSFALTKEWWLLAYFGAFIWFAITGLRVIIQSVLGGGGIRRSPLVNWKNYVSWDKLVDSLLFTGFSVPLLDYLVKSVILDRTFGINTSTNPIILYSIIALANGIYLSSHNVFRGLPRAAAYGNFFRTVLSIPLALCFNFVAGWLMGLNQISGVNAILDKWAAIISKAASDCVAGVIEGMADRYDNLNMRARDYADKIKQVFDTFIRLELLFPESDVEEMLSSPEDFLQAVNIKSEELDKVLIINSLDLLYFWMYQPRAEFALRAVLRAMSGEERRVLESSQLVLQQNQEVSRMFVDGLTGAKFGKPLAFYLDHWEKYLSAFHHLAAKVPHGVVQRSPHPVVPFKNTITRSLRG